MTKRTRVHNTGSRSRKSSMPTVLRANTKFGDDVEAEKRHRIELLRKETLARNCELTEKLTQSVIPAYNAESRKLFADRHGYKVEMFKRWVNGKSAIELALLDELAEHLDMEIRVLPKTHDQEIANAAMRHLTNVFIKYGADEQDAGYLYHHASVRFDVNKKDQ